MRKSLPLALLACALSARADVQLPAIFSEHMVLQSGVAVPVWGRAEPGEAVAVTFAGQTAATKAGPDGRWSVKLKALKPSAEAQTFTVKGHNTLTIADVLVGEVWLGSGQSNMAMSVSRALQPDVEAAAAHHPGIRMFTVSSGPAPTAQADCRGSWKVCDPATVGSFSATAYFFGRELHRELKLPVGLINSSVGGTPIESWISPEAQDATPRLKAARETTGRAARPVDPEKEKADYALALQRWTEQAKAAKASGQPVPRRPFDPAAQRLRKGSYGGLFNGKIAPLIPYAIRGTIWYQGEANSAIEKAPLYQLQLTTLIKDWRTRWGSDFPFAWVQLPNFDGGSQRDWPTVRETMLRTLQVPRTGMAITIDIGEARDIHPKNKQEVGRRLALWALGEVYEKKVPATSGPLPAGHHVEGSEVTLEFSHADGGLVARDGELKGFVIAGEDRQWKPAQARIAGSKVIVSSPDVPKPAAVRYAWENWPTCNLYNGAGLPASPFRTDAWK